VWLIEEQFVEPDEIMAQNRKYTNYPNRQQNELYRLVFLQKLWYKVQVKYVEIYHPQYNNNQKLKRVEQGVGKGIWAQYTLCQNETCSNNPYWKVK